MNPSYDDIKMLAGPPGWYSEGGVPRYAAFSPKLCGIYNDYVALVQIACQSCKREFTVASCVDLDTMNIAGITLVLPTRQECPDQNAWDLIGSFDYGDPPNHDCVGDSMSSVPLRVLQFWERRRAILARWIRDTSLELSFPEYTEGCLQI